MLCGLKLESYRWKDASHERVFGSAPQGLEIRPLGRDVSGIPVVFQGRENSCVSCSVSWIRQWMDKNAGNIPPRLSWPFLARISSTAPDGATPSQVLEPARKTGICLWEKWDGALDKNTKLDASKHRIPSYSFVTDYTTQGLFAALIRSPLAVGILNFRGIGAHMMVAYDVTADGENLICMNWWDANAPVTVSVPFADVELAVSFAPFTRDAQTHSIRPFEVMYDKLISILKYAKT
jgi:hypothetical protein